MSWDSIGAIGELVAATGVIASLVYLALQIRQGNATDKLSATNSLQSSYNEVAAFFLEDATLLQKGFNDWSNLDQAELLKFNIIMHMYFGHVELVLSYDQKNLLDQNTLNRTYTGMRRYLRIPGVIKWWTDEGCTSFSKEFVSFVENETKNVGRT
jgi:hypothetical protein